MQEFLASTNFTVIFISLIGIKFLLETYLKIRNLKSIELNKNAIPERFVGVVTEEEYKKSIAYNIDRIRFQIFTALFGAVVLIIFTLGGLFNSLAEIVASTTSSDVLGAVLLGLLLLIVEQVISIPISIYSTFVIEERHGFNKTTTKTFVADMFKSLLISATISSVIYATVIYIVVNLGDNWWIYAFGAVFILQAIIFFLYPVLIMPLFNKFEPLDNEEFKHQFINTYCDRINTTYSTDHTSFLIDSLKTVVAPYVANHIFRYGSNPDDSYTPNTLTAYNAAVQRMYNFASYRPDNARNEMVELFDLNGATNTVSLFVNDSEAGHIKINTLNVNEQGWSGEYFSDIPISIKAVPEFGYEFSHWANQPTFTDSVNLLLDQNMTMIAHFSEMQNPYQNMIVINEINYNSNNDFD